MRLLYPPSIQQTIMSYHITHLDDFQEIEIEEDFHELWWLFMDWCGFD